MCILTMEIKIKKLHSVAKIPEYAHSTDAGLDIFSIEKVVIFPGVRVLISTGIAMEIPHGFVGLIWDKSGVATKHGLKTLAGVVDAGYRGEIKVGLINLSTTDYSIEIGDKIAQMLIQKVEHVTIQEVLELSDTPRGVGAFGSTGEK